MDRIDQIEGCLEPKGKNGKATPRMKIFMDELEIFGETSSRANSMIGQICMCNDYGFWNIKKAISYFEKSVKQGMAYSAYKLAIIYSRNIGGLKDKDRAEYYARLSCKMGYDGGKRILWRLETGRD